MADLSRVNAASLRLWILRSRRLLGLSQGELAEEAGVGRTTIVTIETKGPSEVSEASRDLIVDALLRSAGDQGKGLDPLPAPEAEAPNPAIGEAMHWGRRIPIIGTVPGGPTALRFRWSDASAAEGFDTVDCGDLPPDGDYFAVRVDGESMAPAIRDGDICICAPLPSYEDIDPKKLDGKVVIIQFTEDSEHRGETTLARWKMVGGRVVLMKDNPRFAALEYPDDGVHHAAVVLERRTKADL